MNYNYLRYFSVLAELEHYTLAAARLEISQPSLSSAIRSLEDELGVKLFEKVGRNIRLTEQGRFFQKKVDQAMAELQAATAALRTSDEDAPIVVRMGFVSGSLDGAIARLIAQRIKSDRRIHFHMTEGSAKDLTDLLYQEKLDMAIVDVTVRDRSLHYRKLHQRDFAVAVQEGHPLSGQHRLKEGDLVNYPQIGFSHSMDKSFEDWANKDTSRQRFVCQVNTVHSALNLVQAGVGVTIVPAECTVPFKGIKYIPLLNRHQALYLCIVYDRWLDPPVWDFAEQLMAAAHRM